MRIKVILGQVMYFICIKLLFFFDLKKSGLIFDFTGLAGGPLSRPFSTGSSVIIDDNMLQSAAKSQMKQYKMDEEKYWDNVKPFWNGLVSLAKDGEKADIKATLKDDCGFSVSKAGLMAQWFVDNVKEAQATQQGKYDFILFYF